MKNYNKTLIATSIAMLLSTNAFADPSVITHRANTNTGITTAAHAMFTHYSTQSTDTGISADAFVYGPMGNFNSNDVPTPASMACIYGFTGESNNCNPLKVTAVVTPNPNAKVIAIVDAFAYAGALSDLQAFSKATGLPTPKLTVVSATGKTIPTDTGGWEMETAMDLQWAHAMAPGAQLILVQATSDSTADLLVAVAAATKAVQAAGGGVVSMSWGQNEFSSLRIGTTTYKESALETYFNNPGVIYLAASGDYEAPQWPCVSQNVICVGGTSIRSTGVYASTGITGGDFVQEVPWLWAGSGASQYIAKPAYQTTVQGSFKGIPDIALAADTSGYGAWVYYTYPGNAPGNASWQQVGGTSWSTPMAAGIIANSSTASTTSVQELTKLYAGQSKYFTDISMGYCGNLYGQSAAVGWDNCSGTW